MQHTNLQGKQNARIVHKQKKNEIELRFFFIRNLHSSLHLLIQMFIQFVFGKILCNANVTENSETGSFHSDAHKDRSNKKDRNDSNCGTKNHQQLAYDNKK